MKKGIDFMKRKKKIFAAGFTAAFALSSAVCTAAQDKVVETDSNIAVVKDDTISDNVEIEVEETKKNQFNNAETDNSIAVIKDDIVSGGGIEVEETEKIQLKDAVVNVFYVDYLKVDGIETEENVKYEMLYDEGDYDIQFAVDENTGAIIGLPKKSSENDNVKVLKFKITYGENGEKSKLIEATVNVEENTDEKIAEITSKDIKIKKCLPELIEYNPKTTELTSSIDFELDYNYEEHKDEFVSLSINGSELIEKDGENDGWYTLSKEGNFKFSIFYSAIVQKSLGSEKDNQTICAEFKDKEGNRVLVLQNYKYKYKNPGSDAENTTDQNQTGGNNTGGGNHTIGGGSTIGGSTSGGGTTGGSSSGGSSSSGGTSGGSLSGGSSSSKRSSSGGSSVTPTYKVSYESNGGSAVEQQSVKRGQKISFLATPVKEGYSFDGWYTDKALTKPFVKSSGINGNLKLYAKYKPINCTIWFETNGGNTINSFSVQGDTKVEVPTPVKEGYSFDGWYTDKELTKAFDNTANVKENLKLYAKWSLIIPDKAPNEAAGFIDVQPESWYYDDVNWVYKKGLMIGYNNAVFAPERQMTVSSLVTVLSKMSGDDIFGYNESNNVWYAPYIKWANDKGIIEDVNINPNIPVTREYISAVLLKYIEYVGTELTEDETKSFDFTDAGLISPDCKEVMKKLYRAGIISGRNSNNIDPKGTANRAEFAALVRRIVENTRE